MSTLIIIMLWNKNIFPNGHLFVDLSSWHGLRYNCSFVINTPTRIFKKALYESSRALDWNRAQFGTNLEGQSTVPWNIIYFI